MGMHAEHVREGVKVPEDHAEHCCLPQEYEDQLFKTYHEMKEMVAQPNMFDIPAIQEVFVEQVRNQLSLCALARELLQVRATLPLHTHQCFHWTWPLEESPTKHQGLVVALSAVPAEVHSSSMIG